MSSANQLEPNTAGVYVPNHASDPKVRPKVKTYFNHMGVSKNRGIPEWMVYNGKPYLNG